MITAETLAIVLACSILLPMLGYVAFVVFCPRCAVCRKKVLWWLYDEEEDAPVCHKCYYH